MTGRRIVIVIYGFLAAALLAPLPSRLHGQNVPTLRIDSAAFDNPPNIRLTDHVMLSAGRFTDSLSRIVDAAVDESGRSYVLDAGLMQVQRLDAQGNVFSLFDNTREVSGRFYEPFAVQFARDTIMVLDRGIRNNRPTYMLHAFDTSGTSLSTWSLPPTYGRAVLRATNHGWYVERTDQKPVGERARQGPVHWDVSISRFSPSDGSLKRVLSYPYVPIHSVGGGMAATPAMVLVPTSGIARDGRIYVNSRGGFTIEVYSRTGNLESRVAGAVVRTPFTAEDFEVWLKREIREATAKGSIEWAKALTDNGRWVGHADFIPTLGRIIPSAGGKFFVERTDLKASNTDQQASHTIWDLVDLERGLLGRLETPTGLVLTDFEWPYVVVMHRSAAVASVSRYRVVVE